MDETKGKIVEAATKLFAERGLDGVTVREICAAAGVNVALVNYHFKSKEGLYAVCIERLFARIGGERIATLDKDQRYYHRTDAQLLQFAAWKPGFEKE